MRFGFSIIALGFFLASPSIAAESVSVTIDGQTYSCSKGGSTTQDECFIIADGAMDKYGRKCAANPFFYCGVHYAFAAFIEQTRSDSTATLATWCRQKLSGN